MQGIQRCDLQEVNESQRETEKKKSKSFESEKKLQNEKCPLQNEMLDIYVS